jgi:hypothetical protein
MKFLNDFKNLFAIVGVFSIIFWTCASESTSTNVNPPQLTGGTYQMQIYNSNDLHVLNTETGVYKKFYYLNNNSEWEEQPERTTTFTH